MIKKGLLFLLFFNLLTGCVEVPAPFQKLPPGLWRATLDITADGTTQIFSSENESERVFTEMSDIELPFNFETSYGEDGQLKLEILNAEERIVINDIEWGKDRITNQDTIRINFPLFDTYISAIYEEDKIQGYWYVNYREGYRIPFNAVFGQSHRFTTTKTEPVMDLSGRWEAEFEVGSADAYKAIIDLRQSGNHLEGTIMTETGDYRYLEGTTQGNKAYLSCFDGSHAFLFNMKILEDGTLSGSFKSGKHYTSIWEAKRNDNFSLRDPWNITSKTETGFDFNFAKADGEIAHFKDEIFQKKPTVVAVFGTWCPNCKDAMEFLKEYKNEHLNDDIDFYGLAFERYRETDKVLEHLNQYAEKMALPFDILLGGYYNKKESSENLSMLNEITAYPTIVLLDEQGEIRDIYTGFTGPATKEYETFIQTFDQKIKQFTNE